MLWLKIQAFIGVLLPFLLFAVTIIVLRLYFAKPRSRRSVQFSDFAMIAAAVLASITIASLTVGGWIDSDDRWVGPANPFLDGVTSIQGIFISSWPLFLGLFLTRYSPLSASLYLSVLVLLAYLAVTGIVTGEFYSMGQKGCESCYGLFLIWFALQYVWLLVACVVSVLVKSDAIEA